MDRENGMFQRVILGVLCVICLGCHSRFREAAPHIETVQVRVNTSGGPEVQLGMMDEGGLVGLVVNVVQAVKAADQTDRLRKAVRPEAVEQAVMDGMGNTLDGNPFRFASQGEADAVLDMDVRRYGMYVPYLGAPGSFDFVGKLTLYDRDSRRIYGKRLRCRVGVGVPYIPELMFRTVNNVRRLKEMSDEEINKVFVDVSYYCGSVFVDKLRKHAR